MMADRQRWTASLSTNLAYLFSKYPIRQLKRQVYLLAHYFQLHQIRVWVEGYVILLHQNSPVDSGYIISSLSDIDRAIHTKGKNHLQPKETEQIIALLQQDASQS